MSHAPCLGSGTLVGIASAINLNYSAGQGTACPRSLLRLTSEVKCQHVHEHACIWSVQDSFGSLPRHVPGCSSEHSIYIYIYIYHGINVHPLSVGHDSSHQAAHGEDEPLSSLWGPCVTRWYCEWRGGLARAISANTQPIVRFNELASGPASQHADNIQSLHEQASAAASGHDLETGSKLLIPILRCTLQNKATIGTSSLQKRWARHRPMLDGGVQSAIQAGQACAGSSPWQWPWRM